MVRIGGVEFVGAGFQLPRNRSRAKACLRSIAQACGVKRVHFVRTTKAPYGGLYDIQKESLIVVEQEGKRKVPMHTVTFRFFHELTHHLHQQSGIFLAYYFEEVKIGRRKKKYSATDRKRVALRAERHANQKACEMAKEFFGLEMTVPEYSREFLSEQRADIFGS
jgi:hypothetical protein